MGKILKKTKSLLSKSIPKNRFFKIALIVVIIALIGGFFGYRRFMSSRRAGGRDIQAMGLFENVSTMDLSETVTASGTVLLEDEIEVYAEGETNKIKSILVEEGDEVTVGELLVEYDVDDTKESLENQIRDIKRDIESSELNLKNLSLAASGSDLEKLENAVTAAEIALDEANVTYNSYETKLSQQQTATDNAQKDMDNAQKDYDNALALFDIGGVSQTELDDYEYTLKKANDSLTEAKDSYNELLDERESARLKVVSAQNSLKEAQSALYDGKNPLASESSKISYQQQELNLEALKDSLSDCEKDLSELVYSTSSKVSGTVTEVCVDEGTYTEENTVILYVADFNNLIVSANIEEYDAPLLELGQKVTMTSDGLEDKVYTGRITKISPSADDTSTNMGTETTVPIEISVDNPDGVLKPGYSLDLEITVKESSGLLMISSSAVNKDEDGTSRVYKLNNENKLEKTVIETGESSDAYIEVISGLSEGDRILATIPEGTEEGMSAEEVIALYGEMTADDSKDANNDNNRQNGGMGNDRNNGANQMLPSGGFGGGGAPGGGPMGR